MMGRMTSRPTAKRIRKTPAERRAEIINAATQLAHLHGLDRLTVRDVASDVGVTPGLLHHYFPQIDDLIAEVFTTVVGHDLDELHAGLDDMEPLDAAKDFLARSMSNQRTPTLALWLSAWVTAPRREPLAREVEIRMADGVSKLADLIQRGYHAGVFNAPEPKLAAWRILVVMDGTLIQRSVRTAQFPGQSVEGILTSAMENELGVSLS
ncbi:TetR/AcrR family transcriptional regulator [Saccharopolyspora elongata]|uniref:TetR/AcrR family transcriptional regulator n=1 Tax=Saccharopolyspora elongata TaxID=2530387 RepID=A0A4R4YGS0_9PSEU|nr:TetR/AcrR family transcriptional regulator [Saccharopolyspora elongata]TDD42432.1 TetR/AcrR family transcriptional regulator [Saccharopolyspora elongata]